MNCNSTPSLKYWRGSKESVRESLSLRPRPFTRVLYWMESGWQKGSRTKSPENRFLLFLLPLMSVRCRTPSPQQTCQALVSYYHFFSLRSDGVSLAAQRSPDCSCSYLFISLRQSSPPWRENGINRHEWAAARRGVTEETQITCSDRIVLSLGPLVIVGI